jgi:hypothetical protein
VAELAEVQEALVVRPGDVLVVRVRHDITMDQFDKVTSAVKERFPADAEILFVAAEQLAVIRRG